MDLGSWWPNRQRYIAHPEGNVNALKNGSVHRLEDVYRLPYPSYDEYGVDWVKGYWNKADKACP